MKINKRELIMVIVIVILSLLMIKSCSDKNKVVEINQNLNDELEFSVNKLGQQSATISVLQVQNELQFLTIKTKDTTIQWLQTVVKNYQGKLDHALVLANNTGSTGTTGTVISYDTIYKYPIYSTMWDNKWERGYIRATRDSIYREIKISNEFEFIAGKGKNNLFQKREYAISVKNKNPNTLTTELRSINIRADPKRLNLGLFVGYGYSLKNYELSPQIGIGINYTILPIK